MFVKQEDRHPGGGDEFVDLRACRSAAPAFGVKRLTDVSRIRWASSQINTSSALRSAVIKLLKYLNMLCIRTDPRPAYLRSVWVKDREPVACRTCRPCRANSPSTERAMTLFPLPGPPATTTTLF